jgi:hypothetical protein
MPHNWAAHMPGSWAISGFAMGIADIGICGACRAHGSEDGAPKLPFSLICILAFESFNGINPGINMV